MKKTLPKEKKPQRSKVYRPAGGESATEMAVGKKYVRCKSSFDRPFFFLVLILLTIGTIMVWTASYVYAKQNYGNSYFFSSRQIIWVALGFALMMFMSHVDYLIVRRWGKVAFAVSMLLMALVPIIGSEANGARRWFDLGLFDLQPSEICKLTVVLFFAEYIVEHQSEMKSFKKGALPFFAVAGLIAVTMFFQKHMSGMIILLSLVLVMMFFGGVSYKILAALGITGVTGAAALIAISSHARIRIDAWLHPELYPRSDGWQPLQSLYAIGSGGFWGVGLGQSRQKHLWLPEPQNDYIFSILCEELGFIFAAIVVIIFFALIWRGFHIARNAPSAYASLLVIGIISHVAIQVILNLLVVTNTIPSTGISLPFFSYGGTSLIILMGEMGMVLNVSRYSYLEKG